MNFIFDALVLFTLTIISYSGCVEARGSRVVGNSVQVWTGTDWESNEPSYDFSTKPATLRYKGFN